MQKNVQLQLNNAKTMLLESNDRISNRTHHNPHNVLSDERMTTKRYGQR